MSLSQTQQVQNTERRIMIKNHFEDGAKQKETVLSNINDQVNN